jgi:tRNA(Arg) A34 adenosine deaminase TadA
VSRRHHPTFVPTDDDHALAAALGPKAAWLPTDDGVWAVSGPLWPTPAFALMQAVWDYDPRRAHARLRRRIRTSAPVTPLDHAAAQVAAKRVAYVPPGQGSLPPITDLTSVALVAAGRWSEALVPASSRLDDPTRLDGWLDAPVGPLATRDRPLLAALVDADGAVLMAARNTAGTNRTRHAEVNLVAAWAAQTGGPLPPGARVVCTLRPCRMCAAMLLHGHAGGLDVVFLHDDPGRLARGTSLDGIARRASYEQA